MKKILIFLTGIVMPLLCLAQSKAGKIDSLLRTYHSVSRFNGNVLVAEKGKVLLQQSYGYQNAEAKLLNNAQTIFQVGSVTKQFTAVIILKLAEQGKLSLSDKLSKYFPGFIKGDSITIHQVLNHTSGIYNYTDDPSFMQNGVVKPITESAMFTLFEHRNLDFSPGTSYKYSNSGYYLLGSLIKKITRKPYEQVVREMIFAPLKMEHSGFDFARLQNPNKAQGYLLINDEEIKKDRLVDSTVSYAAGSMYSTTGDLLKWYNGLLSNKIINHHSLSKAFTPYLNHYGYGWVIDSVYNRKAVHHNGGIFGFTSNVYSIEADRICIIMLTNTVNTPVDKITADIVSILYNKPVLFPEKRTAVEIPRDTMRRYFGVYEFDQNFRMKIFSSGGKMYAQRINDADKFEIYYYKPGNFFLKKMDARLAFSQFQHNSYQKLTLHQSPVNMDATLIKAMPYELYDTVMQLDETFFNAYNNRNIDVIKTMFDSSLIFYHDKTGVTGYWQNVNIFQQNFMKQTVMRRELKAGTAEVYPIEGYGALETGTSNFYFTEPGQEERYSNSPKFVHLWRRTAAGWKLATVISYDH